MSASHRAYYAGMFLGKTVIAKAGLDLGRLWDMAMSPDEPLPRISHPQVKKAGRTTVLSWGAVEMFNVSMAAVDPDRTEAAPFDPKAASRALARRDLFDKGIVDAAGSGWRGSTTCGSMRRAESCT